MNTHEIDPPKVSPPRLSKEWPEFTDKLAAALKKLKEDHYLIVVVKGTNQYVQFAAQGSFGLRAETTANAYRAKREQLTEQQMAQLIEAGWGPPTGTPSQSTPENDPDGSPNFYVDFPAPPAYAEIARLAVTTLSEILRVPYPGFLEYEAFDDKRNSLVLPGLGLKRAERGNRPAPAVLAKRLLAIMREVTGVAELAYDKDGDIGIRYGSLAVFVSRVGNPPHIQIYAPLVMDVKESPRLHARLNELNACDSCVRLFHSRGVISAVTNIPADPLMTEHLSIVLRHFCKIADGIDELLSAEFGGTMHYPGDMPSLLKH